MGWLAFVLAVIAGLAAALGFVRPKARRKEAHAALRDQGFEGDGSGGADGGSG